MTTLLQTPFSSALDSESLLTKLNKSPLPPSEFENLRVLYEFSAKTKNLISFKRRFLKICENFILIYKLKSSAKPHAIIPFSTDLKVEWICNVAVRFHKNAENLEFFFTDLRDVGEIKKILSLKCNLVNFHGVYKAIKKIGKGSFASVYLVMRKDSEQRFAVKSFNKEHLVEQLHGNQALLNEITIMRSLHHQNIMTLHEVYETDHSYYMILEMLEGGSLKDRLQSNEKMNSKSISSIMTGILKGLCYVHQKGFMHRDIKPENILFRNNGNEENDVCIADFGLAAKIDESKYLFSRCGTPGYVAPEILNLKEENAKYTEKCDLFSSGVIYHLMLLGKSPFDGNKYNVVLDKNKKCQIDFEDSLYSQIRIKEKKLLMKLLEVDPLKRITAKEALSEILCMEDDEKELSLLNGKISNSQEDQNFFDNSNNTKKNPSIESDVSPEIKFLLMKKKSESDSQHEKPMNNEKISLPFIMRTTIMNGHTSTIDGLPICSETEEKKHTKFKKGLSVKIYRYPAMEIQSPNMQAALENQLKLEEKVTPETLPEPNCNINQQLLSIKEYEEEDEKNK